MSRDLTEQQRTAVTHRKSSIVLASGAGCGKTHVLTNRYVYHLTEDKAAVGQVVAITFTDRAAREMRERIRSEIEKRPELTRHLRDLESAPIATFHSFCGNLLRQFAIPAGIDPAFEVLDDILSTNLRTEAINHCLRGLLSTEKPYSPTTIALRELIVLFGYPEVVEAVDSLLLEVDRPSWQKWLERKPEDIAEDWVTKNRNDLLPKWVAYLCAASPKIARCLSLLERVNSPNPEVMTKIARLREEVPRLHEAKDLAAAIEELIELAKVGRSGKKDWPDADVYDSVKEAFEAFRSDLPKKMELFSSNTDGTDEAARIGQQFIRIALAADDEYRIRKKRASVLDFQDLLTMTRDLLRDREDVRKSLQQRYRFLLLDELQDTDPVQMELVDLLVGTKLEHDKLFAVGDHKQSIYRFRGADVELFRGLRAAVAEDGRLGLTQNFRSQPGILHFVNALFSKRIPDYDPLVPHNRAVSGESNVEFLWSVAASEEETEKESADQSDTHVRSSVGQLRTAEANAIARRITDLLNDPSPRILDKNNSTRRVERKDIVLLFRSMTHAAIYESALRRHGLDYYIVGGRAFFAQQEVYDLLNVLRAVENPQDSTSLVGALRAPFFNLSDESVFLLASHPDGPWAGLNDPERISVLPADQQPAAERAARWLASWRSVKDRLPIAPLLNRILADSGYDAALQFEFLGDRKLANLWKLIELARSFDRSGLFGLHEFTARLGDLVARQPREEQAATLPENADVVRLMSIHQSKGLEFPVVFIPDIAAQKHGGRLAVARWHRGLGCLAKLPAEFEDLPPASSDDGETSINSGESQPFSPFADDLGRSINQLEDWQEDLRILYVACTRARDLLILSAGLSHSLSSSNRLPANHWTLALEERFEAQTGRCLVEDIGPEKMPDVRVIPAESDKSPQSLVDTEGSKKQPRKWQSVQLPRQQPSILSLPYLEALARGETVLHMGEQFETEGDTDRSRWRSPRERLGPVSAADEILWAILERWNFADMDDWVQLLVDVAEDSSGRKIGEELRPALQGFAKSTVRLVLEKAAELHRNVEFLADLATSGDSPASVRIRGIIDFLYRDLAGWHILGIDRGAVQKDDPWHGRKPGLVVQAWSALKQLGQWPLTIELFDLSTGQLASDDPKQFPLSSVVDHFRTLAVKVV
jgi:ATP-dependent helicase/nuclease subunit A